LLLLLCKAAMMMKELAAPATRLLLLATQLPLLILHEILTEPLVLMMSDAMVMMTMSVGIEMTTVVLMR